ncbi:bifunctional phosphopantothenoylcysteine decarboxylase/phosphopantothenate--cysteine ligase CoaBC [soil metagenome]
MGRKILLGISGSIAAYKSAVLVRTLVKSGAEVKVIMTKDSTTFISPLTLQTLSKNQVYAEISEDAAWNNHVELGLWADLLLIAPATANTLAKMAQGICDNMLTACYLSARCPVAVAPAMDLDMWNHPSTKRNIKTLQQDSVKIFPVGYGELASGLTGDGRMAEPEEILGMIVDLFQLDLPLKGKKILITAGPTLERIDPVRFIGNASSGKMGIAIAMAAQQMGADTTLVYGPGSADPGNQFKIIHVESAIEMYQTVETYYDQCDAVIFAAAVADYRPERIVPQKIKKSHDNNLALRLVKNPDIAFEFGKVKSCVHIGFALESENAEAYAIQKLKEKHFDFIVLNETGDPDSGLNADTNKVSIYWQDGTQEHLPLISKKELGQHIIKAVQSLIC